MNEHSTHDHFDDTNVATIVADVWSELAPAFDRFHAPAAARPARPHRRRVVGIGLGLAVVGAAGTAGAIALLGDPAPPAVQGSIAGIDEGMPADLRLHPDVTNARSVAADGDAVLYAADLPGGGVCTEIAVGPKPAGVNCRTAGEPSRPIEASIPGTPEDGRDAPVVVGGRVPAEADGADVVVAGNRRVPITLAPGGWYVIALDATDSSAARRGGMAVEARQGDTVLASLDVSDAFTPESALSEAITVEYTTGAGDLSTLGTITGRVDLAGAVTLRLVFPDGSTIDTAIGADGRYELVLPADRQGDLADAPGRVVALDAAGTPLGSRVVAAVSWWQTHG